MYSVCVCVCTHYTYTHIYICIYIIVILLIIVLIIVTLITVYHEQPNQLFESTQGYQSRGSQHLFNTSPKCVRPSKWFGQSTPLFIISGTKGVPRKGVWTSVKMRVWTCKESRVNNKQTSCYLRPPFLGTPLVPSRPEPPRTCAVPRPARQPSPAMLTAAA